MQVIYTPQRSDRKAEYTFTGESITVTIGDDSDTFDFSEMPDGTATSFETTLDPCPVISAERIDGELTVKLLYWYGADATEDEKQEREVTV